MTGSACTWDADGVEVSPIQQRAVMRELRRALVDPQLDGVVLGRALHGDQWKEGFDSAVECVDARIEHLTSHIEGLAEAVPPVPRRSGVTPTEQARIVAESVDLRNPDWRTDLRGDIEGALRGTEIVELPAGHPAVVPADAPGDRDHTPAPARATTPGDDRGRELAEIAQSIILVIDEPRGAVSDPHEARPAVERATVAMRRELWPVVHRLRALAAPAETEAGDDGAAARYALATLIDEIGAEVGVAPGQPTLVLTQVRGWMENARRTNVENERLRAAAPPAQGPAETEAGDLARWLGEQIEAARRLAGHAEARGWLNTADAHEARRLVLREVLARLAVTPPTPEGPTTASLLAAEIERYTAGCDGHLHETLTRWAAILRTSIATPPAPEGEALASSSAGSASCPACGCPPGAYIRPSGAIRADSATAHECSTCGGVRVTGTPVARDGEAHAIRDRLAGDEGLTGDETLSVGPDAARSTPGGDRS